MPERQPPKDLDAYLPDEATAEAAMNGPVEFKSKADPKLVARLEELNRLSSSPDIPRPAPPSVAVYAELKPRGANPEDTTLPRAEPKVALAVPPAPSETPTQPSLKRFEGEPEVPGVVKRRPGPRPGRTRQHVPRSGLLGVSFRGAALAVLAVLVPVLLVILLMGRATRQAERGAATSGATAIVPTAKPSAPLPATSTAAPKAVPTAAPTLSAAPSATASAAVPSSTGATPKHPPRSVPEDPYDPPSAPPAPPTPAVTAAPQGTAMPSATAPAAPAPAPTAPPAIAPSVPSVGPSAPAQKPEF